MRGSKPIDQNVVRLRPQDAAAAALRAESARKLVARLRPRGLSEELAAEWTRIGLILADLDRLKAHYCDAVTEYCRLSLRLRAYDDALASVGDESFTIESRYGEQRKLHPLVRQRGETLRQWRGLNAELGLTPKADRHMRAGGPDLGGPADQHFPEG